MLLFLNNLVIAQIVDEFSLLIEMEPSVFIHPPLSKVENYSGEENGKTTIQENDITIVFNYSDGFCTNAIGYYSDTKNVYRKVSYKNGVRNGVDASWYQSGAKMSFAYYEVGKLKSPIVKWFENGSIKDLIDVDWDSNIGFTKTWFENGNLKSEETYIDSTLNGIIVKNYFDNGNLRNIEYGNLGKSPYLEYYSNGVKGQEGKIFNAYWNKIGKWQDWYDNGVLAKEYFFDDSTPNKKTGTWSWWDEQGNLIKQEVYKEDKLIEVKNYLPFQDKKN